MSEDTPKKKDDKVKKKKKRLPNYEKPLIINGTFDDVLDLCVDGNPKPKREKKKD